MMSHEHVSTKILTFLKNPFDDQFTFFISDQSTNTSDVEPTSNGIHATHSRLNLKRKSHASSMRVPSVNVISEVGTSNENSQIIRSQSVGHNMAANSGSSVESDNLLNVNYSNYAQRNGNGIQVPKQNGQSMRYTLSQPLLMNSSSDSEHESKPLRESHKHWRSGTLSRPDIFYQVIISLNRIDVSVQYNKFIIYYRDHSVTFLNINHMLSWQ